MTRVLVVGASGSLGTKIVRELRTAGAEVRTTYRTGPQPDPDAVLADLSDEAALARACDGIDVVISAVQGMRDVIVDGQTRLLRAAESAGVARMLPSDYALDFFKTREGGNRNLDLRREFGRVIDASSSVRPTSVLCGAFMDLIAAGRIGPDKTGVYKVWGHAEQAYDFTHTNDVARYIAAVALDDSAGRYVRVAGDTKTAAQLAALFPATLEIAGSLEQLSRMIESMRASDPAPNNPFPVWQQMQYAHDMASGLGKLDPIDNARYPKIRPRAIRDILIAR